MIRYYLLCAWLVSQITLCYGWGQKGHDTVAAIAQNHLCGQAADSVSAILEGKSMVYWANWLDNASYTPEYAYTKTWHYKNIDADVDYADAPTIAEGNVVTAIREQKSILADSISTLGQKQLALKILIHCVGDLHQPMHLGHLSDRGGNSVKVKFFDTETNLHSIWDTYLLNSAHAWSFTEWRDQIDRLSADEILTEIAGDEDSWASQTHKIASSVYTYFPEGKKVYYNDIYRWAPVIETQLLRGGLRLAKILNEIYCHDSSSED